MEKMNPTERRVILLNSEGCQGEDKDLGFAILIGLLDNIIEREDRPRAIICWNTAVRLLAADSPLLKQLKALEGKGVDILAGQLCVSELGLEGQLAAGRSVKMGEILDLVLHSEVISL